MESHSYFGTLMRRVHAQHTPRGRTGIPTEYQVEAIR